MIRIFKTIFPAFIFLILFSCAMKEKEPVFKFPYPDQTQILFYQARIDSSEFEWLTDSKGMASAFMNDYYIAGRDVAIDDIIINNEGLFRAEVEIPLDTVSIFLTMERPFKERGTKSIWQVINMEKKPWQKPPSK